MVISTKSDDFFNYQHAGDSKKNTLDPITGSSLMGDKQPSLTVDLE